MLKNFGTFAGKHLWIFRNCQSSKLGIRICKDMWGNCRRPAEDITSLQMNAIWLAFSSSDTTSFGNHKTLTTLNYFEVESYKRNGHTIVIDTFLSPVLVSDWLILCCWNLIRTQRNENDKSTNFMMKNSNKNTKKI